MSERSYRTIIKGSPRFGYEIVCDICGNTESGYDTFNEALEAKNGLLSPWISEKHNGEWQDICDECQEG